MATSGKFSRGRRQGGGGPHHHRAPSGRWNSQDNSTRPIANPPSTSAKPSESAVPEPPVDPSAQAMHERLLFYFIHLVGLQVEVHLRGGQRYLGILHSTTTEGELGVMLRFAQLVGDSDGSDDQSSNNRPVQTLIIPAKECVSLSAVGVDFATLDHAHVHNRHGFQTDTSISGSSGTMVERELHRWNPEEHGAVDAPVFDMMASTQNTAGMSWCDMDDGPGSKFLGLEEEAQQSSGPWDQFAANERLFGLKTNFNEEIYTTKLDRSHPNYKKQEAEAERIAKEIMKGTTTNIHVAEERGLVIAEEDINEEDRYGAVIRDVKPGKYMPPAMRRQWQQQQQQQPGPAVPRRASVAHNAEQPMAVTSQPSDHQRPGVVPENLAETTGKSQVTVPPGLYRSHTTSVVPTVNGKPSGPVPGTTPTSGATAVGTAAEAPPATGPSAATPESKPATEAKSRPKARPPPVGPLAIDTKSLAVKKVAFDPEARQRASPLDIIGPKIAQQLAAKEAKAGGKPGDSAYGSHIPFSAVERTGKPIEREILGSGKQFISNEKVLLNQAKQQAVRRQVKEDPLADLVKFSKTFKLKNPIPADVLPIVNISRRSSTQPIQSEETTQGSEGTTGSPSSKPKPAGTTDVQKPSDTTAPAATKPVDKVPESTASEKPASSAPSASVDSTKTTSTKPTPTGFKLNAKAVAFKPNPVAKPFVPKPKPATPPVTAPRLLPPSDPEFTAFFGHRPIQRGKMDLRQALPGLFQETENSTSRSVSPTSVEPRWPMGKQSFMSQFTTNLPPSGNIYSGPTYNYPYGYPTGYNRYQNMYPGPPHMASGPNSGGMPNGPRGQAPMVPGTAGMAPPVPLPYMPGPAPGNASHPGYPHPVPPNAPYIPAGASSTPYGAPMVVTSSAPGGMYTMGNLNNMPPPMTPSGHPLPHPVNWNYGKAHSGAPEEHSHPSPAVSLAAYASPRRSPALPPQGSVPPGSAGYPSASPAVPGHPHPPPHPHYPPPSAAMGQPGTVPLPVVGETGQPMYPTGYPSQPHMVPGPNGSGNGTNQSVTHSAVYPQPPAHYPPSPYMGYTGGPPGEGNSGYPPAHIRGHGGPPPAYSTGYPNPTAGHAGRNGGPYPYVPGSQVHPSPVGANGSPAFYGQPSHPPTTGPTDYAAPVTGGHPPAS
ncbi:poly(A)-binding protein binding protein [Dispira parvispora]|uniref:Poly(A)-binding protein binding protein n=1 Tax=Dispira parvispora TaxID=1520584 RepID=A0A9W8E3H2_9FUNG|nr:poly(A)-binding protein binding protein [Dispira parvispora]